ncbi:MAG: hypothetical protein NC320_07145 [Clostridium sp.]|nr:hypothetical protein [Clostridium sp.]
MNKYFIHTIELYRLVTYSEFEYLNKNLRRFRNGTEYRCLDYEKDGITVVFRKCTDNEKKKKGSKYGYKLIVIFNPSRLIENSTYINRIWNKEVFASSITLFNEKIKWIFEKFIPDIHGINDFTLGRVDITKDILCVPENIIQEYIKTLRRFPLSYGYALNTQLEENCPTFKPENSLNIVNKSSGFEFVLYNKHQAMIDQNYPDDIQKHYADTLRMELRCGRKSIKKNTKNLDTLTSLVYFYVNMESMVEDVFYSLFSCDTDLCFVSHYWLEKVIKGKFKSKEKKQKRMLKLVNYLHKNPEKSVDEALTKLFPSKKSQKTIMDDFYGIALSPVAVQSADIPFMQSVESLLEFAPTSQNERKYFDTIRNRSRGKDVFLHCKDN